jgi:hypothetical protein
MSVENKRHTNAHQPFTSLSPTEVSIPPSPPCQLNFSNSIGKSKSFNYLGVFVCSANVSLFSPFPSFLPIFRAKFEPNDGLKLSLEQSAYGTCRGSSPPTST